MALGMFKESLKFQATEKEANKQQTTEWQGNVQSWFERGHGALVKAQIQTLEGASSQTENGIEFLQFYSKAGHAIIHGGLHTKIHLHKG